MSARLPIPAVGTKAYKQWRRGAASVARPTDTAFPSVSIAELSAALGRRIDDLVDRANRLPESRPELQSAPVERVPEVDVTDPEWIARHEAWLATEQGQAYSTDLARPWTERSAEIWAEHCGKSYRGRRRTVSAVIDRTEGRFRGP